MSQYINLICDTHKLRVTCICIENHNCPERRLCDVCINESHKNIAKEKFVPINAFYTQLQEKIRKSSAQYPRTSIFQIIHQLQQRLQNQFEQLSKIAENTFKQFKFSDFIYDYQYKQEFERYSKYHIDFMIQIVQENYLEHQAIWYGKCFAAYQTHFNILEQKLAQAFDQLEHLLKQISNEHVEEYDQKQIFSNVFIEGAVVLGEKQGDFFYKYDDGTKEFAGKFLGGLKYGKWKEYIKYDKLKNMKQFYDTNYLYGDDQGPNKQPFGIFDQEFKKSGKWIETNKILNQKSSIGTYQNNIKLDHWKDIFDGVCWYILFHKTLVEVEITIKMELRMDSGENLLRALISSYIRQSRHCQVTFLGNYIKGKRSGKWTTVYNGKILGQGVYNNGIKVGLWVEVHQKFSDNNQVISSGNYNKGVPIGFWQTLYNGQNIGGGQYDEKGEKNGKWTELHENFNDSLQVTYSGAYQNNQKIGEWLTLKNGEILGGGEYDQKGLKIGQWIEIDALNDKTIANYVGTYKEGIRSGTWKILYNKKQIGGGEYDNLGFRSGKWVILYEKFNQNCQVVLKGEYKNNVQIDQWSIVFQEKIIGGGIFDDQGKKTGLWTELFQNFNIYSQVTFSVHYKNGMKQGQLSFLYCGKSIGGGNYNKDGFKDGKWIDIHENFNDQNQVTYEGSYNQGIRQQKWSISYNGSQIGGGSYDNNGIRFGQWIEIHENFNYYNQVTFSGEYKNGVRQGEWKINYRGNHIGGGLYDQDGVKSGIWTDLHENFYDENQVTQVGEYRKGLRFGQWSFALNNKQIGGGQYNEEGIKNGNWMDLHTNFFNQNQLTFQGSYRQGIRKGQWIINYKNQNIGGGTYNNFGIKNGKWIDIDHNFNQFSQVVYQGNYDNGIPKGQWETINI